ncbi:MAG: AI-2E family transporter [Dysgonomonas sp.]|nr:AI-2E family transporter [Dysgonomonas sp.]
MNNSFDRPYTFDRVIRLVISVLLIGAIIYFIYILRSVLLPFLVAWLIAYLLNPIVRFIQKRLHLKKRFVAVLITFALLAGILTLTFVAVTPMIKKEIVQINQLISTYQIQSFTIDGIPMSVHDFIEEHVDFKSLRQALSKQSATESLKYIMPAVQDVVSGSISFIFGFTVVFIILLYLIFILLDYDKINQLWMNLIPHKYRTFVSKLTLDVERSMNNYFRHQALICLIVAVLFATGFQIIGLPLAIVLGVLIGMLHMVPYLHTISIVPAILLAWLKVSQTGESFWTLIGLIALMYIGIQCIIDVILVPRIMGRAMGLNPAVILLSLSIWGSLMGIAGMIIAIPLTTLLLSYYQEFINTETDMDAEEFAEMQDEKIKEE